MNLTQRLQSHVLSLGLPEADYGISLAPGVVAVLAYPDERVALVPAPIADAVTGWRLFPCQLADDTAIKAALIELAAACGYLDPAAPTAPPVVSATPTEPTAPEAAPLTLTPGQQAAVAHGDGPARVLAGAGTGKTRVIVARFEHLVQQGVSPDRILALTFSRAAARQMRDEILRRLPGSPRLWISTFHSFCLRVLEEGRHEPLRLVQEPEARAILRGLAATAPLTWYIGTRAVKAVDDAVAFIGHVKEQMLTPEDVASFAASQADSRLADLAELYRRFQADLADQQAADFADFITRAVTLLQNDAALAATWQQRFDHILVDEFQDTNQAQFEILTLLARPHGNLMVVGDDDQAIYRFRGATERFMVDFPALAQGRLGTVVHDYPVLENFRCPAPVLDVANTLIGYNGPARVEKELFTTTKLTGYPPVAHWEASDEYEEASAVAAEIARRIQAGASPADFAILCRSVRRSAAPFVEALEARSVPCHVTGEETPHPVTTQTLALLRLLQGVNSPDLLHVIAARTEPQDLHAALREAKGNLQGALEHGQAPTAVRTAWATLQGWLQDHAPAAVSGDSLEQLVYDALRFLGHLRLTLTPTEADLARLAAARDLQEQARQATTLDALLAAVGGGIAPAQRPGARVQIRTIHSAKGLQFPVVFVVGMVEERFPVAVEGAAVFHVAEAIRQWVDTSAAPELTEAERLNHHLREERRLAYVAVTRAERELILTRARRYGAEATRPSRFLAEMQAPAAVDVAGRLGNPTPLARSYLVRVALGAEPYHPDRVEAAVHLLQADPFTVPLRRQQEPRPFQGSESLRLSASSLETYRDCPRKYYYSKVLGLPDEPSIYASFGSALHGTLERFNRTRMTGVTLPWAEIEQDWQRGMGKEADEFETRGQFEHLVERGRLFLQRYHGWATTQPHQVVAVEEDFVLPYTDGQGRTHTVRGRMDLVVRTPAGLEIVDYKSGHRKGSTYVNKRPSKNSPNNADRQLQLGVYHMAWTHRHPGDDPRITYIFLRHLEDKPPTVFLPTFNEKNEQVISTGHTADSLGLIRGDINAAVAGILANDFHREPDQRRCGMCPYQNHCEVTEDAWF